MDVQNDVTDFEAAYIHGDFDVIEKALEAGSDTGCVFPYLLLYDAVRIGRSSMVRILLENYSQSCCDERTLKSALRDAIYFHDLRQLCDWDGGQFDQHLRDVTLRTDSDSHPVQNDCPCERADIVDMLITNGASIGEMSTTLEELLITSPVVCPISLTNTIDVLIDHGCDLSDIVYKFVTCSNLYLISRVAVLTILARLHRDGATRFPIIANVLPIFMYHTDKEGLLQLHDYGYNICRTDREQAKRSHPAIRERCAGLADELSVYDEPCSLRSTCRSSVRGLLSSTLARHVRSGDSEKCRRKPSLTTTTLIRSLPYPTILKRYLSFDGFHWRRA